jgi:hypothetical protein
MHSADLFRPPNYNRLLNFCLPHRIPFAITMKFTIAATLVAAASAFSVQKDFAKVSSD